MNQVIYTPRQPKVQLAQKGQVYLDTATLTMYIVAQVSHSEFTFIELSTGSRLREAVQTLHIPHSFTLADGPIILTPNVNKTPTPAL